jgi:hypothetical protein
LSAGDGAIFEDGDAPSQLEPSMRSFGRRVFGTGGRSAAAAAFGAFVEAAAAFDTLFDAVFFSVAFLDGACLRTTGPSDKSPSDECGHGSSASVLGFAARETGIRLLRFADAA